jgi:hypothetical protein
MLIDTLGQSLEAEDNNLHLVEDAYTPAFDTHDFHADLTNESAGTNYAAEPVTSTEITVSTGTLTFDAADTVFDNGGSNDVTITDAMASVLVTSVSGTATDQLIALHDFVTAASCSNSTFTVQWNAAGLITLDLTP